MVIVNYLNLLPLRKARICHCCWGSPSHGCQAAACLHRETIVTFVRAPFAVIESLEKSQLTQAEARCTSQKAGGLTGYVIQQWGVLVHEDVPSCKFVDH